MYFSMRKTLSLDLRQRILDSYDEGKSGREQIARRFRVSLGMVKKLLVQREKTKDIAPRHRFSGRKAYFTQERRHQIGLEIQREPDITLEELRDRLSLRCTLPAIHYVLRSMNLTFKKNVARQRARKRRRSTGTDRMEK